MKNLFICTVIFISAGLFSEASAQNSHASNKAQQPGWAPPGHEHIEYLFLPEISTYYYVPRKQFIYQSNGYWTFSSSLPATHKKYDLHEGEKVVINEPGAYMYFAEHRKKYSGSMTGAVAQD